MWFDVHPCPPAFSRLVFYPDKCCGGDGSEGITESGESSAGGADAVHSFERQRRLRFDVGRHVE